MPLRLALSPLPRRPARCPPSAPITTPRPPGLLTPGPRLRRLSPRCVLDVDAAYMNLRALCPPRRQVTPKRDLQCPTVDVAHRLVQPQPWRSTRLCAASTLQRDDHPVKSAHLEDWELLWERHVRMSTRTTRAGGEDG
ncbi:hypothetical protein C8R45DRAFT_1115304 [Mycena sanguinolenta]|nr:hypothetical protein C8R45DRAFT_1115304 [Mycena sanguinolenta]